MLRPGSFYNAHHFVQYKPTVAETIVYNYGSEIALERLAAHTIQGAEYNSSARDPPPACHPNTRTGILQRAQSWLRGSEPQKKILWLYGPAGVGKSAIVQTLAELEAESTLGATLFFSKPSHRDNPKLVFNTIAYQLAVSYPFYRDFIIKELAWDPKLVEKAMSEQFKRFIVKPFAQLRIHQGPNPLVILIDGLDECKGEREQGEIVTLIAGFTIQHPTAPLLWVVASRPEVHLQVMFSRKISRECYWTEEVPVDSDEACGDVERYLREKFEDIKESYSASFPPEVQWPTENDFLKLMTAALGLFAFADTVIRFIDDPEHGDPVSQWEKILDVVDHTKDSATLTGESVNPLATLHALYARILSAIPDNVLPTTLRILGQSYLSGMPMLQLSNLLGMTQHCMYGALQKLHSVVRVPLPLDAHSDKISSFHASFHEYIWCWEHSGVLLMSVRKVFKESLKYNLRILQESTGGLSKPQPSNVVLSWPSTDPEEIRRQLYRRATISLLLELESPSEDVLQELPRIIESYMNLKFGDLAHSSVHPGFIIQRITYQAPHLRDELVRCKFMNSIPIIDLQVSQINKDEIAYVSCTGKMKWPPPDHRGFDFIIEPDFITGHVYLAMAPLRSGSMAQALLDFEDLQYHSPSAMATVFGVGSRRVVYFEREITECHWRYVLPYPES